MNLNGIFYSFFPAAQKSLPGFHRTPVGSAGLGRLGETSSRLFALVQRLHPRLSPAGLPGAPCVTDPCQTRRLRAFVPEKKGEKIQE